MRGLRCLVGIPLMLLIGVLWGICEIIVMLSPAVLLMHQRLPDVGATVLNWATKK